MAAWLPGPPRLGPAGSATWRVFSFQAEAVVAAVEVLHHLLDLVEREAVLRLLGPARDGIAQVGKVLHVRSDALVHALVMTGAAVRLVEQATSLEFLRHAALRGAQQQA